MRQLHNQDQNPPSLPGSIKANLPSHHHLAVTFRATMLASGLLLVALLACLVLMVFMSVWWQRELWGKLPPGPTPLPFIRNYLQLDTEQIYDSLMKVPSEGDGWNGVGVCA